VRPGERVACWWLRAIREARNRPSDNLWLQLFQVLSWFYRVLVGLRQECYRRGWFRTWKLPAAVISVGNMVVGGTGKTPLVERIARELSGTRKVAVLLRGYGGVRSRQPMVVSDGTRILRDWTEAGDEALLLARNLPGVAVVSGVDRVAAGDWAVRHWGAELLLLDDGFQHLRVRRDLDLVLLDGENPFAGYHLFPRGLLREPAKELERADGLVVIAGPGTGREGLGERDLEGELRRFNRSAPIFVAERAPISWMEHPQGARRELEEARGKRCLSFCGIGNPDSFHSLLCSLGLEVVECLDFPDHHPYSLEELERIVGRAKRQQVPLLVTTEKDAVRIPACFNPFPLSLLYLRIQIRLRGEEEFFSWVKEAIGGRRAGLEEGSER